MDTRTELPEGTVLRFPGMDCRITGTVGRGSNGIVYRGCYEDGMTRGLSHEVLIKELFPLHASGAIFRGETGGITAAPDGKPLWDLHLESFRRGNAFHLELLSRHPERIGGNLNTFPLNGTFYSIFGCSGGSTLDRIPREGLTLSKIGERMLSLLDALEVFHQAGCLHMDISPDNILVLPGRQEQLLLIDFNSVSRLEEWRRNSVPVSSTKQGYSAPEVQNGDSRQIGFPSDLYSAAAVFFYLLTGRQLSLQEKIASAAPTASESAFLADAPETVRSMVKRILRRGLNALPSRRYPDIAAMRADLAELLDRISCVGVTHWALWEREQAREAQRIRRNPALSFLKKEELYPIRIENGDDSLDLQAFLKRAKAAGDRILLLQAQGGMGKTTCLTAAALKQNAYYSPAEPVAVLLSAAGFREGENWFIHDRILEMLNFRKDTKSYADARHELDRMLEAPLRGNMPAVLLFLDGLNEVSCGMEPLLRELRELSALAGIAVAVSSRTQPEGLEAKAMTLRPLEMADVEKELSERGLLLPENAALVQLLRTPMMLSMFIRSAGEGQARISRADDLLPAVMRHEADRFPEDTEEHWQTEAALRFFLPAVAAEQLKKKRALSEAELLGVARPCFRLLRSAGMVRVFPAWTAHRKAILNGARRADEWLSRMLELLWRKTGFLLRDEQGGFSVVHQQIAEWLSGLHRENAARIGRQRFREILLLSAALLLLAAAGYHLVLKPVFLDHQRELQEKEKEQSAAIHEILNDGGIMLYAPPH